jgi:hypothetical protein
VIRFHCPKCGRECLLSSALIGVPLLCKGCGDRLAVPEVSEPLDEPPRPAFDRSLPEEGRHDILVTPTVEDSTVNLFVSTEMRKKLFMPIEGSGQPMPPAPPPEAERLPAVPASSPSSRKWLGHLVDAAAVLLLLVLGATLGSLAVGKPTRDILGDAPASPRFPPTDLLIWVASVVVCGLLYVWLITRGWSLGARLTRR